jgi:hypothetical protein
MPKIHSKIQLSNLAKAGVAINDTAPNSTYFRLAQVPEVLTIGKNAFLINGSSFLNSNTEVKIELVDANGNPVFVRPIKNYQEGLARLISIEVYADTAPGLATLTILGELVNVAEEWKGKYNVKWQKQINIDLTRDNTTPIRLFKKPVVTVSETLSQYRPTTQQNRIVNGGAVLSGIAVSNPGNTSQAVNFTNVVDTSLLFTRYGQLGSVTASIDGNLFSSSISSVLNSTTAFLSSKYPSGNFSTTNFTMSFAEPPSFFTSSLMRSFAVADLNNLRTFAGKVHRVKVYSKNVDSTADYEQIGDVVIEAKQFLTTQSADGTIVQVGDFSSQAVVDQYWTSSHTANEFVTGTLVYDSSYLLDSVHLLENPINAVTESFSFGPINAATFTRDSEYTLAFDLLCNNSFIINPSRIDVYVSGSAFASSNKLGIRIGKYELDVNQTFKLFTNETINFVAPSSGLGWVRFVIWGGNWNVSKVRLESATERGYNPDETVVRVPISNKRFEHVKFRVDLLDANNNTVVFSTPIESDIITVDGGNTIIRGTDNRVDGSITLSPNGSGVVLTSSHSNGGSGIVVNPTSSISSSIFIGSTPAGSQVQIGNVFSVQPSGNFGLDINSSGTWAVRSPTSDEWVDVRFLMQSYSIVNTLYSQEITTGILVSASIWDAYSASVAAANLASISASIVQALHADVASLQAQIAGASGSAASATILNAFNRVINPPSVPASKSVSGLYLESNAFGYWNATHQNWPVYFTNDGNFRVADSSSWVSGSSDPYTRMVGFAGGVFVVRTNQLYMSASGFQIAATSSTGTSNFFALGGASSLASGQGVYMDGGGNFRIGTAISGSDYMLFIPGQGAFIRTARLIVSGGNMEILADPASAAGNVIRMGTTPRLISLTDNAGFYADGAGNFRIGTDSTGSNFIQFSPGNALQIKSNNFFLFASTVSASITKSLTLNSDEFSIGYPAPTRFDPQTPSQGTYYNNRGQFFVGSSSYVNPSDPANQTGNFISYGGQILNIRSSFFRLAAGGVVLDSANGGLLALGAASGISTGVGVYADGTGVFRVGNPSANYLVWDGSNVSINTSQFVLSTTNFSINTTVNNGTLIIGSATNVTTGAGIYATGNGVFRVGTGGGTNDTFIKYENGAVVLQGKVSINDTTATDTGSYVDIAEVIARKILFSPMGYFMNNL